MFSKRQKTARASAANAKAEREVKETLGLLGSVPEQAPPFFYTRLKARLDEQRQVFWERWLVRDLRPSLALAGMLLLLLVNLYCVLKASEQTAQARQQQAAASFAEEYEFTVNQY
jgi:hypothetical protein